jgi:hypothetical protein
MLTNLSSDFRIVDTTAPFDFFAKNGYYQVGNEIFNHKILALQCSTAKKLPVQWIFNNKVYDNLDWKTSNGISLPEMYRLRAEQLRQKYQYLILCWSGGADSTTILDTFLKNNIVLDEIVILWPRSQTQGKYTPVYNVSNKNMLSEWDFAIQPKIEEIRNAYPNQLITIADVMAVPNRNECTDDTVLISEKHTYGSIQRWRELDKIIRLRSEKNHNVAAILGVQPPTVVLLDNQYLAAVFVDDLTHPGSKSDYMIDGTVRNIEFFYMTPDMPELIREQAHAMYKHLEKNPECRQLINHLSMQPDLTFKTTFNSGDLARQLRKKVLYPDYSLNTLQVNKQNDTHDRADWFEWFWSNPHSEEFLTPWRSAIESHQALIDPKFFQMVNGRIGKYQSFSSKFYPIGKFQTV